jgi:A/G-specific adenine glycosylase
VVRSTVPVKDRVRPKAPRARLRTIVFGLLAWFGTHRRPFPWRETRDPYAVLVAEILLKKTGANAAATLFPAFLRAYPTVSRLARARMTRLEAMLAPIGLSHQRARHLKDLGTVLEKAGGQVRADDMPSLPGVGSYTSLAVRCFAFGEPVAPVDTNVTRVLGRAFSVVGSRSERRKSPEFWALADLLVQLAPDQAREVNWAILDLADAICTDKAPKCGVCPITASCDHGKTVVGQQVRRGCRGVR